MSLRIRKLIETKFGWMKTVGTMRKTKLRGTDYVDDQMRFNAVAFNLLHLANLLRAAPASVGNWGRSVRWTGIPSQRG